MNVSFMRYKDTEGRIRHEDDKHCQGCRSLFSVVSSTDHMLCSHNVLKKPQNYSAIVSKKIVAKCRLLNCRDSC